jgi:N-acetylglutamate synthase-like GNAT family acetyltransferase
MPLPVPKVVTSPFTKYFFYKRFLRPNFSSNELDSISNFVKNSHLITLNLSRGWWYPTKVIGGCAFEYYPKSGCALITYLILDDKYRSRGFSSQLFVETLNSLKKESGLKAILIETKRSNTYAKGIFERWGFHFDEIDNYIQPALSKYKDPIFDLSLGIYRRSPSKVESNFQLIKEWLDEFVEKIKK